MGCRAERRRLRLAGGRARPSGRPPDEEAGPRPARARRGLPARRARDTRAGGNAPLWLAWPRGRHRREGGRPLRGSAGGRDRAGHRRLLLRGGAGGARRVCGSRRRRPRAYALPQGGRAPQARGGGGGRDRRRGPLHELRRGAVLLAPPRRRRDRSPGRPRMAHFAALSADAIARNLERVRERIAGAGGEPAKVEICAAIKYVPVEDLPALRDAGITLVGENRAQDLEAKHERHGGDFTWDFIGALQSRKVKQVAPLVRLIHSVASDSALNQLGKHPVDEILVEVNIAGEEGKAGIAPAELGDFITRSPVPVTGLMTMPPVAERPEDSRPHFAKLAELASQHGLERLSMGTTQDFEVAVSEGATIVRLGTILYRDH